MPKKNPYQKQKFETGSTPAPRVAPPPRYEPIYSPPEDESDDFHYNSLSTLSIIALICVILSFIGGQIWTWIRYGNTGNFFILSNIVTSSGNVEFNDYIFGAVASAVQAIATVIMCIVAVKLDDTYSIWLYAIAYIPFCIFSVVVPVMTGILLLAFAIVLLILTIILEDDDVNLIYSGICAGVVTIICVIIGIIGSLFPGNKFVQDATNISSFSEISSYTSSETVSLNLVNLEEDDCGRISTETTCKRLIVIGHKGKIYKGLSINTQAEEVVVVNLRITQGYIRFNAENSKLTTYGLNEIYGTNGSSGTKVNGNGSAGVDGSNGGSAIYAKNLILGGNSIIKLTAGNGGNGSNGSDGNSAFLGSGSNGGNGGDGGDSGYVIDCVRLSSDDFHGKLVLTKGTGGDRGLGGKGGSGGLFGSSGSNGRNGTPGKVRDYISGGIDLQEETVIYS